MASNYNKIFYYTEESNILTIKKVKYLKNKKIIEISRFKIPTKGDKIFNLNKVWPKIECPSLLRMSLITENADIFETE